MWKLLNIHEMQTRRRQIVWCPRALRASKVTGHISIVCELSCPTWAMFDQCRIRRSPIGVTAWINVDRRDWQNTWLTANVENMHYRHSHCRRRLHRFWGIRMCAVFGFCVQWRCAPFIFQRRYIRRDGWSRSAFVGKNSKFRGSNGINCDATSAQFRSSSQGSPTRLTHVSRRPHKKKMLCRRCVSFPRTRSSFHEIYGQFKFLIKSSAETVQGVRNINLQKF